ncbi:hypothetical protein Tco_0629176 [Tanacetum coccineum]|uniref:Uncharacterized protein n=1 Tax=Tanacetum coccineum TaxID=301880 RepID=A0ABQ4WSE1_9ASTR
MDMASLGRGAPVVDPDFVVSGGFFFVVDFWTLTCVTLFGFASLGLPCCREFGDCVFETVSLMWNGHESGPNWLFDIDALTKSMNYKPIVAGNQSNGNAGTKACDDAGKARMETFKSSPDAGFKPLGDDEKKVDEDLSKDSERDDQDKDDNVKSTNNVNAATTNEVNAVGGKSSIELPDDLNMPELEDIIYSD